MPNSASWAAAKPTRTASAIAVDDQSALLVVPAMAWAATPKASAPPRLAQDTVRRALPQHPAVRCSIRSGFLHLALGPGARGGRAPRRASAPRAAAPRHLRGVPRAAALRLLGARRRQPHLSPARRRAARRAPATTAMSSCCCAKGVITPIRSRPTRCAISSSPASAGMRILPEMTLSRGAASCSGDVLLVCTDGLWAPLDDAAHRQRLRHPGPVAARDAGRARGAGRRRTAGAGSDNTSRPPLRCSTKEQSRP